MRSKLITAAALAAVSIFSACTFNVSTGANNSNAAANSAPANAANASAAPSANQTANAVAAPKKEEESVKKSEAPASGNSVRVQFAKGETSTSVTKDIPANGSVDFMINMKKGQKMGFTVGYDFDDNDVYYALYEPDTKDVTMSAGPKEQQEFEVKVNGDHRLAVTNTTKKKITVTLYVDVE